MVDMAGIHQDRGDRSHKLVSGEAPVVGMRVFTNDWEWGTIIELDKRMTPNTCGWYCEAWHSVELDSGSRVIYNCDRLTTRKPR